jgi:hypothetical protein
LRCFTGFIPFFEQRVFLITNIRICRNASALSLVVFFLIACAGQPYSSDPSVHQAIAARSQVQSDGDIQVAASVPSNQEAEQLFGLPLHKRGVQAVWLKITNGGEFPARFSPYGVDKDYFPPYEVAYIHKKYVTKQTYENLENQLDILSVPRDIAPGETVSGYLFTHSDPGTKSFNVDVFFLDGDEESQHFTFFIDVPGFRPDYAEVSYESIYGDGDIRDLSHDAFRMELDEWACCTTHNNKTGDGRPLGVVFISEFIPLFSALLRAEWSETNIGMSDNQLIYKDIYFDRNPDVVFRKKRDRGKDRNELSLWLAPVRVDGKPVWIAQMKHAIGRAPSTDKSFSSYRLDPDTNQGRNYLLQEIWYAQALAAYAWSDSGTAVPEQSPQMDFLGNPWYSDGLRAVLWVSDEPVSMTETNYLPWFDAFQTRRRPQ